MRKQVGSWRLFFMVFPLVAVTWDTNFVIWGVQNISFDKPGAYPGDHFVSLGTREAHMGAQNQIFGDLN